MAAGKDAATNVDGPRLTLMALFDTAAVLFAYWFLYVYQSILGVKIPLVSFKTLFSLPLIAGVVVPMVHYLVDLADPLQRGTGKHGEGAFFRRQFPSLYLVKRCKECPKSDKNAPGHCGKSLINDPGRLAFRWFRGIFTGILQADSPNSIRATYMTSYTCRLVHGIKWMLVTLLAASAAVITGHLAGLWHSGPADPLTPLQVLFPLACLGGILLLLRLHRASDTAPTGCWHAWREVNQMHVAWMQDHEEEVKKIVCEGQLPGGA